MASEDCLGEDSSVRDTFSLIFLSVLGTCPQIHKQKCGCVAHMDFHTHRHQKPLESLPDLLWRPYSLSGLHNWQPYSLSVRVAQQQSPHPLASSPTHHYVKRKICPKVPGIHQLLGFSRLHSFVAWARRCSEAWLANFLQKASSLVFMRVGMWNS